MSSDKHSLVPILLVIGGGLIIVAVLIAFTFVGGNWILDQSRESPSLGEAAEDAQADSSNATSVDDMERISLADARAAFELGNAVFVDVRSREAYDRGHVPGTLSIPLGELEANLHQLSKDQWILIYCT